jgi:hypothetical protein
MFPLIFKSNMLKFNYSSVALAFRTIYCMLQGFIFFGTFSRNGYLHTSRMYHSMVDMELSSSFGDSNRPLVNVCIPTYAGRVT